MSVSNGVKNSGMGQVTSATQKPQEPKTGRQKVRYSYSQSRLRVGRIVCDITCSAGERGAPRGSSGRPKLSRHEPAESFARVSLASDRRELHGAALGNLPVGLSHAQLNCLGARLEGDCGSSRSTASRAALSESAVRTASMMASAALCARPGSEALSHSSGLARRM